jgi:hypothetical protein
MQTTKINWSGRVNAAGQASRKFYPRRSSARRIAGTAKAPIAFLINEAVISENRFPLFRIML